MRLHVHFQGEKGDRGEQGPAGVQVSQQLQDLSGFSTTFCRATKVMKALPDPSDEKVQEDLKDPKEIQ